MMPILLIPRDLRALYSANSGDRFMHEIIIRELVERIARLEGGGVTEVDVDAQSGAK